MVSQPANAGATASGTGGVPDDVDSGLQTAATQSSSAGTPRGAVIHLEAKLANQVWVLIG